MDRSTERVVVVGAGPGGLAAVDALRTQGHTGEIVLVGDEPHAPYDRPPLSKQVLAGTWAPEKITLRSSEDLAAAGVDLRRATRAVDLDTAAHVVALDDGSTLSYDALIVATGVRARPLPFGHDLAGVHTLRGLDDTLALRADLDRSERVVVVGAGFLGAEAAAVCRELGHPVAMVDPLELPLHTVLGDDVAAMVAGLHREHGVDLHPLRTVGSFTARSGPGNRVASVVLDDGTELPADVVVVAIGATPATDWLHHSEVRLAGPHDDGAGGVLCDATGRATDGVWAIGDVAAWWDPIRGRHVRVEHRLTANEHARTAARDLLGGDGKATATAPYFWSDQYDLKLQSFGLPSREHRCHVVEGSLAERRFVAVYTDADTRVTAVVGAGRAKAVRSWRQAVIDHRPLGDVLAATP